APVDGLVYRKLSATTRDAGGLWDAAMCPLFSAGRDQFPEPTFDWPSAFVPDWPPHKNRMRAAKKGGGV
ncbi:MAG: hypothetical protein P8186_27560, partial [Anaerolineae bacterium]